MALADIREQIKLILSTAEGSVYKLTTGVIHDYFRWSADWDKFLQLMSIVDPDDSDKRIINGWMITREKAPEKWKTSGYNERSNLWRIKGFYGLNDVDASELKFQDLIEGICEKFRTEYNLNDSCQTTYITYGPLAGMNGMQVESIELRVCGTVLCHACDLLLGTMNLENR